ncbi:MAG TPA: trypsin-like peptidase domain-containing protein [Acidimicrobiales bacterium]|nr:trypsin-like peptidase domain-containing protein [Acidimicrobiales bacterium]
MLDDDHDDGSGLRPLPSPDDRLWRHPSEVGAVGGLPPTAPPGRAHAPRRTGRGRGIGMGVVWGLFGAAVTVAVLSSIGAFDRRPANVAVEEVRVPITTTSDKVQSLTAKVLPSLVRVDTSTASGTVSGTGIVFRTDGYILTTAENVHGAKRITVQLSDGTIVPAKLLGSDASSDVAVLRIARRKMQVAVLAAEDDVVLGEPAIAIACMADRPHTPDVSVGVVSAMGKRISVRDGRSLPDMIQTNVPSTGSDVGAALLDTSGAVIGLVATTQAHVTTADDTTTTALVDGTMATFQYATPISYARQIADELIATGHVVHAWLGVETSDLSGAQQAEIGQPGARVDRVVPDSPAQKAGLMASDVVVRVDRTRISSSAALVVELRGDRPGQSISISYVRDGTERVTTAKLVNRATDS